MTQFINNSRKKCSTLYSIMMNLRNCIGDNLFGLVADRCFNDNLLSRNSPTASHESCNPWFDNDVFSLNWHLKIKPLKAHTPAERNIQLPWSERCSSQVKRHALVCLALALVDRHRPGQPDGILRKRTRDICFYLMGGLIIGVNDFLPRLPLQRVHNAINTHIYTIRK